MKNKLSDKRVESIMESLEGLQPAAAPNFFFTRLKAKMLPQEEQKIFFMLRPAFLTAALSVLLILNVVLLFKTDKTPKQDITGRYNKSATIESFAKAYNMNTESVYE